jgi:hypothetical protein
MEMRVDKHYKMLGQDQQLRVLVVLQEKMLDGELPISMTLQLQEELIFRQQQP